MLQASETNKLKGREIFLQTATDFALVRRRSHQPQGSDIHSSYDSPVQSFRSKQLHCHKYNGYQRIFDLPTNGNASFQKPSKRWKPRYKSQLDTQFTDYSYSISKGITVKDDSPLSPSLYVIIGRYVIIRASAGDVINLTILMSGLKLPLNSI